MNGKKTGASARIRKVASARTQIKRLMLAAASPGKKFFFIMPVVTMSGPPVRVKAFPYFGSLPQASFLRRRFFRLRRRRRRGELSFLHGVNPADHGRQRLLYEVMRNGNFFESE
jgi:hypothetical protein